MIKLLTILKPYYVEQLLDMARSLFQTSLSFSGADNCKKLPYELKNTRTDSTFKSNLKKPPQKFKHEKHAIAVLNQQKRNIYNKIK